MATVNSYCKEVDAAFATQCIASRGLGRYGRVWISWNKPLRGWMKLNVDGSVHLDMGTVGAGGTTRNELGEWEDGFTMKLGCNTLEETKSWALLHSLRLAWERGTRRIIVETDSLTVYKWIKGLEEIVNLHANVI